MQRRRPNQKIVMLHAVVMAVLLSLLTSPAFARKPYNGLTDEHPLKIVRYFLYPVGKVVELTVTRPLQAIGSVTAPQEYCYDGGLLPCTKARARRPDHRRR